MTYGKSSAMYGLFTSLPVFEVPNVCSFPKNLKWGLVDGCNMSHMVKLHGRDLKTRPKIWVFPKGNTKICSVTWSSHGQVIFLGMT